MQGSVGVATMQQPKIAFDPVLAANVRPGDRLKADAGFSDHIADGAILTVRADKNKRGIDRLFVPCSHGRHYLSGQIGDHGELVGFSSVT